ncbi:DUF475 domain-containing protein [Millisia brevis]|uniref:DUF475 domain-containing protein n=1 Tax=Millisia brevis TaxID=264148 RepID=UPI00082C5A0B|nr:DUF475 domain-containing protein [Millisia brevis]
MIVRTFGVASIIALLALAVAFLYQGWTGLALCAILAVLEVSLSFDNAVINATILERMNAFWQRMFLTVGVLIAVFGMRLFFPLAIVWITAGLSPVRAFELAMNPPADGSDRFPDGSASYELILREANPQIAAFGGMFLLLLFLNFMLSNRELLWLRWLERPLAALGKVDALSVVIATGALLAIAEFLAPAADRSTVLVAGMLGMMTYLLVNGLSALFAGESPGEPDDLDGDPVGTPTRSTGPTEVAKAAGRAGFFLFLYLELLDASFSFDGVIGAFAITADPILIALGLGIGALFVRSLTIFLVRKGTLAEYRYLEHGAHWAIGALATILLLSVRLEIPEIVTGLTGIAFIGAAFVSSIRANRRDAARAESARVPAASH